MIKFDFTNTDAWQFIAVVFLASARSEDGAEIAEMIADDMMCANDADDDVAIWDYTDASKACTKDSRFDQRGTCDHCGAHFNYGAAYKNGDDVAIVGNICATNKLCMTAHQYADAKLRRAVKAARTKLRMSKKRANNEHIVANVFPADLRDALNFDHGINASIKDFFVNHGTLSSRQVDLIFKLKLEVEARPAEPEWSDVKEIEGNGVDMVGVILATKLVDGMYDTVLKMLVHVEGDYKVWGTYPTFKCDSSPTKGDRISFTANVEVSPKDAKFGFFKRPRKAYGIK